MSHLCLIYNDDQYRKFKENINNAYDISRSGTEEMFVIPTLNGEMNVLLNKTELKSIYLLLDSADTEMQAARLTSLFS